MNGRKWSYCEFRRGHAYAPGSAAASEPAGLWGKRRPGSIHLPADARAKKQKRPASVQRQVPSLDGRITGRMRTCGFDLLQYDRRGVPYGPYCH
jgi:hypothetical protein